VKELIDGDVIELALLRTTHGGTFSKGYDNIFWSFLQDLGQAPWWGAGSGGITCAKGWPEQSRESGTLQRAGEHRYFRTREGLFGDPGRSSSFQVGADVGKSTDHGSKYDESYGSLVPQQISDVCMILGVFTTNSGVVPPLP
jgi:hypothetical protein